MTTYPGQMTDKLAPFLAACLKMEASGNHGSYGGGPGGSVDMRRGIWFWGTGRGWQLYKNWRDVFAARWPDVELPPRPELPPKPLRVPRKRLDSLADQYRSFRGDVGDLEYWDRRTAKHSRHNQYAGWRLMVNLTDANHWGDPLYLGQNSDDAAASLCALIVNWKQEHNLTGLEPELGGQPERTGREPVITHKDR